MCTRFSFDRFSKCDRTVAFDVHDVDVSELTDGSWFTLVFTDRLGTQLRATPVPKTAKARQLQEALLALPNFALPTVQVSKDDVRVTYLSLVKRSFTESGTIKVCMTGVPHVCRQRRCLA